jgi:hypothetical protein
MKQKIKLLPIVLMKVLYFIVGLDLENACQKITWGGHSMYKPSDTCVIGVILRRVLFWESWFFGTILLYNYLKSSIF